MKPTPNSDLNSLKMLSTVTSTIQNPPKNFSNLLIFEEKNQTKELYQAVMAFKNPKNMKQISEDPAKEQIIIEVIRICNKLAMEMIEEGSKSQSMVNSIQEVFELGDSLRKMIDVQDIKMINLEISFDNNYGTFNMMIRNYNKARECLKSSEKILGKSNKLSLWGLTYNNLATLSSLTQEYFLAYKYAEQTLYKLEPSLFNKIKENPKPDRTKENPEFMTELNLVLIGYIHLAMSLEYLHKNPDLVPKYEKMTTKTSKLFYQNGHKLASKYLSSEHYLTKKFRHLLNHGIEENQNNNNNSHIKAIGSHFNVEDSEENPVKNSSFLNNLDSFDRNSENEEFLSTNKKNKAFRVQTRKSFQNDIRAKSLNKVKANEEEDSSFQGNYSNSKLNKSIYNAKDYPKYKRQIKEIDKTIKEMKKLKEKYERNESTFFIQKNFELLLQQKELEDFISKRRDFQYNPMYNTSGMFYMPQQQPPIQSFLNLNKSQVESSMATELIMQKQREMEVSLLALQKENLKILQEKEEKSKEMDKLKDYVIKLEAERTSTEFDRKIKNSDNSKENKAKLLVNELNIAPASSFNNLNESNISESSNKAKDNLKKDEKKMDVSSKKSETDIKPVAALMKRSTPMNDFKKDNNNTNAIAENVVKKLSNPPLPVNVLRKSSSKTLKDNIKEKPNQEPDKALQEKTKEKTSQEKLPKQEKPQPPEKKSSISQITQINNNSHDPLNKRAESIKKILVEFKGSNFSTKNLDSKKQDSLTSMDLALEGVNPSHLLRNILSSFQKAVIVRKKVFIDNKVFIFEFRILQENEIYVFKLMIFYEATGKSAIKEEILQISLIRKILQNIDYRDVIPLIYPLKTISSVMKFSRYFILPFLGIGDGKSPVSEENPNDRKVEIWPKAHGLIDRNIHLIFMGDEFFIFFHFLINDTFRLILSNSKNPIINFMSSGMTLRIEYQFDASSMKKFFEALENNKPNNSHDEILDMAHVVEILEDEDIKEEMIKEAQSIISKYYQTKNETDIFIENYKIIDLATFISFLEKTIKEFEELLKFKGFNELGPLISEDKTRIFKVKVWNEGNRYRFGIIFENVEKKEFEITMKNGFETHAPQKKMAKALGMTSYPFEGIWKNFGLLYQKMDTSDKLMISNIILDSYTLEIFEKVLDKEDYDRYDENPIIQYNLECGGYFRTFFGSGYKYPLTMSLIGYQGVPVGIKAVIFDPYECKESGMLFTVNSELWRKKINNEVKKKATRYISIIPLEGDFYLHYLLSKVGYKVLLNTMQFEKGPNGIDILGKCLIKGSSSLVDNLENVITMTKILDIYRNE